MKNPAQLETFTAGVETSVDVAEIQRQLTQLWQMAAESEKDPARRAITRASLFNFVAYCETEAARDHAAEIIDTLTPRYPNRTIVLLVETEATASELSASISANCHLAGGGRKQICCEQITIHATGQGLAHLGSAVLPLLESDLPTVLWWQGSFLERDDLFRRLGRVVDRVIFDSSMWPQPEMRLTALAKAVADSDETSFADLSWTRLGLWRKLVAEFFDEPHCRAELEKIHSLNIVHGQGPGARLRALLYAGWVAAQLGWSAEDTSSRVRVSARDDSDASGFGILSVELKTDQGTFCLRKNYGEQAVSATVEMPNACSLPRKRAFWPTDDASLIALELDQFTRHTVYQRALAMASAVQSKNLHERE